MKKIIITTIFLVILPGLASLTLDTREYHIGKPAFALCTTEGIKNDCCFKFFQVLEGSAAEEDVKTRERKALAEFKRCMRADTGCSVEMTEQKSKSVQQVKSLCK